MPMHNTALGRLIGAPYQTPLERELPQCIGDPGDTTGLLERGVEVAVICSVAYAAPA